MMRAPRTINAALLAGFLVIFAVWLLSAWYVTARLADTEVRNAAIQARYARGQELLAAVRSQVLLGSIYVRDALIGIDQPAAAAVHDQLRTLQEQVDRELQQYDAITGDERDGWRQLERELHEYWETAVRVVAPAPAGAPAAARVQLLPDMLPRRDVILELSDDIRQVMADAITREQQELGAANQRLRRRIRETTAAAVLVGISIAMLSTWYVNRLEGRVRRDHAEVARQRLELRELSGRLVNAQEDERRSISRELHDEIGQALTAVDVELAVAAKAAGSDGRAAAAIQEARSVTQRALAGVRDLSQLLRPSMLDDFGLPDTLKLYLRRFSDRTGVRTELIDDRLDARLPIDLEVCIYRAIQEALTNVSRHAQASACRVFVQRLASSIVVTVEDDGVGLPAPGPDTAGRRTGLGLVGMRERVAALGGTVRVEGPRGKGTHLTIELPLAARA